MAHRFTTPEFLGRLSMLMEARADRIKTYVAFQRSLLSDPMYSAKNPVLMIYHLITCYIDTDFIIGVARILKKRGVDLNTPVMDGNILQIAIVNQRYTLAIRLIIELGCDATAHSSNMIENTIECVVNNSIRHPNCPKAQKFAQRFFAYCNTIITLNGIMAGGDYEEIPVLDDYSF